MPNAWDDGNLKDNLEVLASLREGDNILLNTTTGRYARQQGNNPVQRFFTQTLARKFTSDLTITNDDLYLTPLTKIFEQAKQRGGYENEINAALVGLRNLQRFYQKKYGATKKDDEKSNRIDAILAAVEKEVQGGQTGFEAFRDHYRNRLVFGFSQRDLIPKDNAGVCRALCLDWLRRKIKSGKDSFAVSKTSDNRPTADDPFVGSLSLPKVNNARMRRKADRRLIGMQAILDDLDLANKVTEQDKLDRLKAQHDVIAGMRGVEVESGPREIFVYAVDGVPQFSKDFGERLFRGVLEAARKHYAKDDEPSGCYMLALSPGLQATKDGHAVAFHLNTSRLHFMDPNVGEFEFHMPVDYEEVITFMATLWKLYWSSEKVCFSNWRLLNYWFSAAARL